MMQRLREGARERGTSWKEKVGDEGSRVQCGINGNPRHAEPRMSLDLVLHGMQLGIEYQEKPKATSNARRRRRMAL
jgi:hypothetical protein